MSGVEGITGMLSSDEESPEEPVCCKWPKCEHGRQKCKGRECGGSGKCPHGQMKYRCKECGGSAIRPDHGLKGQCKEGGSPSAPKGPCLDDGSSVEEDDCDSDEDEQGNLWGCKVTVCCSHLKHIVHLPGRASMPKMMHAWYASNCRGRSLWRKRGPSQRSVRLRSSMTTSCMWSSRAAHGTWGVHRHIKS